MSTENTATTIPLSLKDYDLLQTLKSEFKLDDNSNKPQEEVVVAGGILLSSGDEETETNEDRNKVDAASMMEILAKLCEYADTYATLTGTNRKSLVMSLFKTLWPARLSGMETEISDTIDIIVSFSKSLQLLNHSTDSNCRSCARSYWQLILSCCHRKMVEENAATTKTLKTTTKSKSLVIVDNNAKFEMVRRAILYLKEKKGSVSEMIADISAQVDAFQLQKPQEKQDLLKTLLNDIIFLSGDTILPNEFTKKALCDLLVALADGGYLINKWRKMGTGCCSKPSCCCSCLY